MLKVFCWLFFCIIFPPAAPFVLLGWLIRRHKRAKREREQTILRAFSYRPPAHYEAAFLSDDQIKAMGLTKRKGWL
jgi:hypothetical protein